MRAVVPGTRGPLGRGLRVAAFIAAAAGVGALAWTAGAGLDLEARARLIRYVGILTAAALAVGAPYLLYPNPRAGQLQLSNPTPARLLRHQLGRWLPVVALLAVPAVVLGVGGDGPLNLRAALAAEGALAACGLGLYVLARTSGLGPRSRAWERGEAGRRFQEADAWAKKHSTASPVVVPAALMPGLLLTAEVFLVGSAVAVVGQASGRSGWGVAGAVALVAVAAVLLLRQRRTFDRLFWTTNGVWTDSFQASAGPDAGREPLSYTAVYWAPAAVRPAVWAGLVSLDRRLPLGRVAAVGLVLVAAVHLAEAPAGVRVAVLLLWMVGVNGAVALTADDALVPGALAHRLHGAAGWALARFLMNVRWLPPLVGVLALLAWLTRDVVWSDVIWWTGIYTAVAALCALAVTAAARVRFRRTVA